MIESSYKLDSFRRVEFWGTVTLFVFVIFFFITDSVGVNTADVRTYNSWRFAEKGLPFDFYANYFFPQLIKYLVIFGSFSYLNFIVIPQLIRRKDIVQNVISISAVTILSFLILGVLRTWTNAYLFADYTSIQQAHNVMFFDSFLHVMRLLMLLLFYTILKSVSIYLLENADKIRERYKVVTRGGLLAFIIWSIVLFIMAASEVDGHLLIIWTVLIPSAIMVYWAAFSAWIPATISKKKGFIKYIARAALQIAIGSIAILLLALLSVRDEEFGASLAFANFLFQVFITVPLSWVLFKRHMRGDEEIYALKSELGKSTASLDFLRSQINPHFLFNALNTLYGTAIQEKADKTSEGIQQLGDMMRFMLQENLQDKISLARETEYLNNYINLQKLRTDSIPQVRIDANIEETVEPVQIAPMLLIPFVENAFKHGISFREPSLIKVSLEFRENTLYFDVLNNKHHRLADDPEKAKSGIGLNNVKQRLQHMYPGKHELIIRETTKEFFVHLTVRLIK